MQISKFNLRDTINIKHQVDYFLIIENVLNAKLFYKEKEDVYNLHVEIVIIYSVSNANNHGVLDIMPVMELHLGLMRLKAFLLNYSSDKANKLINIYFYL